jgi:hypothetical protein
MRSISPWLARHFVRVLDCFALLIGSNLQMKRAAGVNSFTGFRWFSPSDALMLRLPFDTEAIMVPDRNTDEADDIEELYRLYRSPGAHVLDVHAAGRLRSKDLIKASRPVADAQFPTSQHTITPAGIEELRKRGYTVGTAKPKLTPEQFVDEVNRRLPSHSQYRPGMRIFLYPPGSNGGTASGLDFDGPDAARGVTADIENQVMQEFDVTVPQRRR